MRGQYNVVVLWMKDFAGILQAHKIRSSDDET